MFYIRRVESVAVEIGIS